jgi:hypothetical protein
MPHVDGTPEAPRVEERPVHFECFLRNVGAIREIHILHHGMPLCGFTTNLPDGWPWGHIWVRIEEKHRVQKGCGRMMTFNQVLPKDFLVRLYDTAQALAGDDAKALMAVRKELGSEWAAYCFPDLVERERELDAKLARHREWIELLAQALRERRPGIRRVLAEDLFAEDLFGRE